MKPVVDELELLSPAAAAELRAARRAAFDVSMRQSVMEYDAADLDRDQRLEFREFSRLVREREMAIHTEEALRQRFDELDTDGSGTIEPVEWIKFALRDALARSAVDVQSLLESWDANGNGEIDPHEFRRAVGFFGFAAHDEEIDAVFREFDVLRAGVLDLKTLTRVLASGSMPRGMKRNELRAKAWRDTTVSEEALVRAASDGALADEVARASGTTAQRVERISRAVLDLLSKHTNPSSLALYHPPLASPFPSSLAGARLPLEAHHPVHVCTCASSCV